MIEGARQRREHGEGARSSKLSDSMLLQLEEVLGRRGVLGKFPVDAAPADDSITGVVWLAGTYPLILFSVVAEGKWTAAAVVR